MTWQEWAVAATGAVVAVYAAVRVVRFIRRRNDEPCRGCDCDCGSCANRHISRKTRN